MRDIFKETIAKYPGYVSVLLELDSSTIESIHNMEDNKAKEILSKLASKKENNKENQNQQEKILYYINL